MSEKWLMIRNLRAPIRLQYNANADSAVQGDKPDSIWEHSQHSVEFQQLKFKGVLNFKESVIQRCRF